MGFERISPKQYELYLVLCALVEFKTLFATLESGDDTTAQFSPPESPDYVFHYSNLHREAEVLTWLQLISDINQLVKQLDPTEPLYPQLEAELVSYYPDLRHYLYKPTS